MPEALAKIRAAISTALPGSLVLLGPRVNEELTRNVVVVGWPGEDGTSVAHRLTRADGLTVRYDEALAVGCALFVVSGSTDPEPLIEEARVTLATVEGLLKSDPTLGGAVDLATLGPDIQWLIQQTADGAGVHVYFDIIGKSLL